MGRFFRQKRASSSHRRSWWGSRIATSPSRAFVYHYDFEKMIQAWDMFFSEGQTSSLQNRSRAQWPQVMRICRTQVPRYPTACLAFTTSRASPPVGCDILPPATKLRTDTSERFPESVTSLCHSRAMSPDNRQARVAQKSCAIREINRNKYRV